MPFSISSSSSSSSSSFSLLAPRTGKISSMDRRKACIFMAGFLSVSMMMSAVFRLAQACAKAVPFNGSVYTFVNCLDLPVQQASIAWSLLPQPANTTNYLLQLAFSGTAPSPQGWVGWGLNPRSSQMVGSSTFLAYRATNGTNLLPYFLSSATISGTPLSCSPIDYVVRGSAVQMTGSGAVTMLVALQLNTSQLTTLFHVWNRGPSVTNFHPAPHSTQPNDLKAVTQINMFSGLAVIGTDIEVLKNRHAVINVVAWGIILPIGVMTARYAKPFVDPAWFYIHILLQGAGYVIGVSGWATGLQLERASHSAIYHKHKNIGTTLFALSTLQVIALLMRPKKEHKLRSYWNVYHHSIGYSVVVLGIINVLLGFTMLGGAMWPRHAFICGITSLGTVALLLELITWLVFLKKRKQDNEFSLSLSKPTNTTLGPTEHILRVL